MSKIEGVGGRRRDSEGSKVGRGFGGPKERSGQRTESRGEVKYRELEGESWSEGKKVGGLYGVVVKSGKESQGW